MKRNNFLPSAVLVFCGLLFLSGCTLVYNFDKQKSNKNLKQLPANKKLIGEKTLDSDRDLKALVADQNKIKKFKDYQELKDFLAENDLAVSETVFYRRRNFFDFSQTKEAVNQPLASRQALKDLDSEAGLEISQPLADLDDNYQRDYSQTNVQVEGVDEADIIKSDGNYIYAISRNNLFLIKAYPAENLEILSKIEFKSRPSDIFINGNRLAVFGLNEQINGVEPYQHFRRRSDFTFLKIFDITDRKNPKQIKDLNFEGLYYNSRLIGNYIYFLTVKYDYYYLDDSPVLPRILEDGEELKENCVKGARGKCFTPSVYYFDLPYDSYNFTTITAININDVNEPLTVETYLMSSSQNMYVSRQNIYLAYTKYLSEYQLEMEVIKEFLYPRLSKKDQERINKIELAENYILSAQEKREKIYQIIIRYGASLSEKEQREIENELRAKMKEKYLYLSEELEKTVIHKIAINQDKLKYIGFGEVTGQVLNQFSMDERDGYFRVATTKNQSWSRFAEEPQKSYCNLFILDEEMKIVGELKGLAEDERIYAVRYMQDRAYLVTFKQTDPLFVIDLSNPKKPLVLGMLKIPGFSNYLHPYDNNILIGIGKETKENEWGGVQTLGLKFSLFDVSQPTEPKELDSYLLGGAGSDSVALFDHRAFLFSKKKNLLVVPVSLAEKSIAGRRELSPVFNGAVVFLINNNKFEYKGRIDHSEKGVVSSVDYWDGYNYYDNTVKRSLYIENVLFTFSNNRLLANDLNNLSLLKELKLNLDKETEKDNYNSINN